MLVKGESMKSSKFVFLGIIVSLGFSGCAYRAKSVRVREDIEISSAEEKQDIELRVSTAPEGERNSYFKDYIPLHIHIKNKTDVIRLFEAKKISLPVVSVSELKKKVPQVIGSYFVPSAVCAVGGFFFFWQVGFPLAVLTGAGALIGGANHKKRTVNRLEDLVIEPDGHIEIKPYTTIDKVVFVKRENYNPQFTLEITEKEDSGSVKFDVLMREKKQTTFVV
jgi:hypothetical protein